MKDEKRRKPKAGKPIARPKLTVDALLGKDDLMSTLADARDRLSDATARQVVILLYSIRDGRELRATTHM